MPPKKLPPSTLPTADALNAEERKELEEFRAKAKEEKRLAAEKEKMAAAMETVHVAEENRRLRIIEEEAEQRLAESRRRAEGKNAIEERQLLDGTYVEPVVAVEAINATEDSSAEKKREVVEVSEGDADDNDRHLPKTTRLTYSARTSAPRTGSRRSHPAPECNHEFVYDPFPGLPNEGTGRCCEVCARRDYLKWVTVYKGSLPGQKSSK